MAGDRPSVSAEDGPSGFLMEDVSAISSRDGGAAAFRLPEGSFEVRREKRPQSSPDEDRDQKRVRARSVSRDESSDAASARSGLSGALIRTSSPQPQRRTDPRLARARSSLSEGAAECEDPLPAVDLQAVTVSGSTASTSYANIVSLLTPPPPCGERPSKAAPPTPESCVPPSTGAGASVSTPKKRERFPPIVADRLPNWCHHLREIRTLLGYAPHASPYGNGVRFMPHTEAEHRAIQSYLTSAEQADRTISWFHYGLPSEKNAKFAIRGLPVDTPVESIEVELKSHGFHPVFIRPIRARAGRPGCIFFAEIHRIPDIGVELNKLTEFLCMRGVKFEAWRGKKGPAQCHRCQTFRHSSHNCHKPIACVRCGGNHPAHECDRPKSEPPTCANCGGAHTANSSACPVFQKECRNKQASTVSKTKRPNKIANIPEKGTTTKSVSESARIRTPANEPTTRSTVAAQAKRRRRKRKGKGGASAPPTPAPPPPAPAKPPKTPANRSNIPAPQPAQAHTPLPSADDHSAETRTLPTPTVKHMTPSEPQQGGRPARVPDSDAIFSIADVLEILQLILRDISSGVRPQAAVLKQISNVSYVSGCA